MPTPNPRIAIVVTNEQRALLNELGALQGRSAASLVRELLDGATPFLTSALALLRVSASVQDRVADQMVEHIASISNAATDRLQVDLEEYIAKVEAAVPAEGSQAGTDTSIPSADLGK